MANDEAADPTDLPQVLVLQGGGALGAYQAGVVEALHERGLHPDWTAGISIGAINAAIVAGNRPEVCVTRLRQFWDRISSELTAIAPADDGPARKWFNGLSADIVSLMGAPGFFRPRNPWFVEPSSLFETISIYDTAPLRDTLLELIDFDLLNKGTIHFSVGAVSVTTGNMVWFDSHEHTITPEHIMASGALPPGFPPVMIGDEAYWDGGLVSNTPLQRVLDLATRRDMTIYQVDLFSSRGAMPENLSDVVEREKDIRYSSRTRLNTDVMQKLEEMRLAASRLAAKLPASLRDDPDVQALSALEPPGAVSIMHLINRRKLFETYSKDYEFSRATVNEHWKTGWQDAMDSTGHPLWLGRDRSRRGIVTYDLNNPDGPRVRDAAGVDLTSGPRQG